MRTAALTRWHSTPSLRLWPCIICLRPVWRQHPNWPGFSCGCQGVSTHPKSQLSLAGAASLFGLCFPLPVMPHKPLPWRGFPSSQFGSETHFGDSKRMSALRNKHTAAVAMWDDMEESPLEKIHCKPSISADQPG